MTAAQASPPLVSIVIVNYKVPEYLIETIRSIHHAELSDRTEIIVVDNASNDGSPELVAHHFPQTVWIQLKHNIGFGKACNVGVHSAKSEFILLLNPDTVIARNTLSISYEFLASHPDVGLMGPKILNPDGTLQASCKRGFPTPSVALYHFSGLSRVFPKSKRFGRYNLSFIGDDQSAEVDAVSGSFMFLRKSLYLEVGGFDERFFLYGEDLDLCHRIRETGHKIWYHPETQIIHRKGKSSAKSLFRSRIAFYEAMILFSRKYRKNNQGFFPGWLLFIAIVSLSVANIGINLIRHFIAVILDLSTINTVLWAVITLRFPPDGNPYHIHGFWYMLGIHSLLSASFISIFGYNGIYSKRRYTIVNTLLSGLLATALFSAVIYFVKQFALSRIAFATSSVIISFLLVGWRELIPRTLNRFRRLTFSPDNILIVGNGPVTHRIIKNIERQHIGKISGIVWNNGEPRPGEYDGYPVFGCLDELKQILPRCKVDILIVATAHPWYSHIIDVLSNVAIRDLTIQWVPHDLTTLPEEALPAEIPLRDFSV